MLCVETSYDLIKPPLQVIFFALLGTVNLVLEIQGVHPFITACTSVGSEWKGQNQSRPRIFPALYLK